MATKDTQAAILEAALTLFRERGFDETTMRDIAAKAKVASGLAYYYFDSKDAIVLAFYQQTKDALPPLMEAAHQETKLAPRLKALIEAKLTYLSPYRKFLGALLGHSADPHSPLSPFGEPSRHVREAEFETYERALKETGTSVPKDLAPHMAKILWFYQMGVILFWMYDRSPQQKRTRALLDVSLQMVVLLIKLSNIPLFKPARRRVLDVIGIVES